MDSNLSSEFPIGAFTLFVSAVAVAVQGLSFLSTQLAKMTGRSAADATNAAVLNQFGVRIEKLEGCQEEFNERLREHDMELTRLRDRLGRR